LLLSLLSLLFFLIAQMHPAERRRRSVLWRKRVSAGLLSLGCWRGASASHGGPSFVPGPRSAGAVTASVPSGSRSRHQSGPGPLVFAPEALDFARASSSVGSGGAAEPLGSALTAASCLGAGLAASQGQLRSDLAAGARRALPKADWSGFEQTGWDDIKSRSLLDVNWLNIHGLLTVSSASLFLGQITRIVAHQAPSELEVWITTAIYLPWIYFCWRDTDQLEEHYRVTFYASCGWAFMSLSSLISVFYQDKFPEFALGTLFLGNVVFALAGLYFYGYHWTRMWRHYTQNRFRPLWIPGLLGLMSLHGLTIADFVKRLDDGGWWKTVCLIYPEEWWWVADVRIIELFVTAAALLLIVLHIQGVFTGMKNAAIVVICTIFAPLGVMALESTWLKASAWQHYLMTGPKYW